MSGPPPPPATNPYTQQRAQQQAAPPVPGGVPRMPSAWQPTAPTTSSNLQQAAAAGQQQQPQQQSQQQAYNAYAQQPMYHPQQYAAAQAAQQQYYGQYQAAQAYQNPYSAYPQAGGRPGGWQPNPPPSNYYAQQQQQQQQQQTQPSQAQYQPPAKPKRLLVITDKKGNPIDLGEKKSSQSIAAAATAAAPSTAAPKQSSEDAGSKLREAALARIAGDDKKDDEKKKTKEMAEAEAEKKAEEQAKQAAEELAKKKADEEAELEAKKKADELAAAAKAKAIQDDKKAKEASAPKSSLQSLLGKQVEPAPAGVTLPPPPGLSRVVPAAATAAAPTAGKSVRRVYSKQELMKYKDLDTCLCRPLDLPDMTIERGQIRQPRQQREGGGGGGGGQREGGSSSWSRGQAPPRRQNNANLEQAPQQSKQGSGQPRQQQWSRGQAPPPQAKNRGGRGGQHEHEPSDDFQPLTKSANHWKPQKNTSRFVVAEKNVKSILNKMTKEKFEKLSQDMCNIPLESYDILVMIIKRVYEKAIDEPSFGDMYADLCFSLSHASGSTSFVHIVESDEDVTEENKGKVYRWSNDVSTSDSEIVGPFESAEDCDNAALSEDELPRIELGDKDLELVSLQIRRGIFIKTMKKKDTENEFYTVYFPVSEAEECGQQLSEKFLSRAECVSDANKQNSFKRSLLNKCEDEFNKQDIYADWKKEKAAYEQSKNDLEGGDRARKEKEDELEFRRIKIKKQMLGNIKFIGQLFKKGLLKEKIMRYCIGTLLKLKEDETVKSKNPEYKDMGEMDMDNEDHEALCNMFATIGKTIDTKAAAGFMNVCFAKFEKLGEYKALDSRARFMYKDLLDLRHNGWVPRRKEEKAKTIEEIRKDFEEEERRQAAESAKNAGSYNNNNRISSGGGRGGNDRNAHNTNRRGSSERDLRGRGSNDDRRSSGFNNSATSAANRPRQPKPAETDDDGFTTIVPRGGAVAGTGLPSEAPPPSRLAPKKSAAASRSRSPQKPVVDEVVKPAALTKEKLERRVDSMRSEFMQDPSNTTELLLSMDELAGTQDAGSTLVSRYADRSMDCKDDERKAIISILTLLVENQKLTKDDIRSGLADSVEFVDSTVLDCPKAYEYLGEMLAPMIQLNVIDVNWLCEQCEKPKELDPESPVPALVVKNAAIAVKTKFGPHAARSIFSYEDAALCGLIGADNWSVIKGNVLA